MVHILLVEDNPHDHEEFKGLLDRIPEVRAKLQWYQSYDSGLDALVGGDFDLCFVANDLDENRGVRFLEAALGRGSEVPIVLLSPGGSRKVDLEALQTGAADFLVKGRIKPEFLDRSIRHALLRQEAIRESRDLEVRAYKSTSMQELGELACDLAPFLSSLINTVEVECSKLPNRKLYERVSEAYRYIRHLEDRVDGLVSPDLTVNVHQVALETVNRFRFQLPKRIHLTAHIDRKASLTTSVSPVKLERALFHLLKNSQEAITGDGTISVRVLRETTSNKEHRAIIEVQDCGCGMSVELQQQAVNPFFTTKAGHAGLGLSIVAAFAKAFGGSLEIYSSPNEGTTGRVSIPLTTPEAPRANQKDTFGRLADGAILILDTQSASAQIFELYLQAAQLTPKSCSTIEQGLNWYAEFPTLTRAVLLDVDFGHTAVQTALTIFRQRSPLLPVALFGDAISPDLHPLLHACSGVFFERPLRHAMIISWIQEMMAKS